MKKITLIFIGLFLVILYMGLGRDYLYDWDEGIYGEIGREIVTQHNLLTPTWNGDLWLEKPPIIGWVTALGIALYGENELGARLFMPLFATLTLYAIFRIGEKIGGTLMGTISAGVLGYCNLFLARARAVNVDGMLLATIAWTTWLILAGSSPWLVGLVMGLAIMVKGPAGILAILIALPLLIKKTPKYVKLVVFSFLLTVIPWHLYSLIVHRQSFITPYLLEQVVQRATVPIEFHAESRWFYFRFLYEDLGIGVLFVSLIGLVLFAKKFFMKQDPHNHALLTLSWVSLPLVIFTLAKTRLTWYILPVYPGLALAIGYGLTRFISDTRSQVVVKILAIGILTEMLYHSYQYVAPFRPASPLADTIKVALDLSAYPGSNLAMLVSPNERVAQAILPKAQTISSSFRYGGAPSVVWYSKKHVEYYYNYDDFIRDVSQNKNITQVIVATPDLDKVPSIFKQVTQTKTYAGYTREAVYAQR